MWLRRVERNEIIYQQDEKGYRNGYVVRTSEKRVVHHGKCFIKDNSYCEGGL